MRSDSKRGFPVAEGNEPTHNKIGILPSRQKVDQKFLKKLQIRYTLKYPLFWTRDT